jgi:membrane protease YdiL (CAAX protease family)
MIQVAARPAAGRVTVLILSSALLRSMLAPLGSLAGTFAFAACLAAILWFEGAPHGRQRRWSTAASLVLGTAVGLILIVPIIPSGISARPFHDFWTWGAVAALVASLEEGVIRGPLQQRSSQELSPLAGLLLAAVVFALIHLPGYGLGALPMDFAVGLGLGGLRLVSGRILPCTVAHCLADWGAWFWA